ncbi:MAG: hypothetical protein HY755_00940 [Nitrospirae bacterium]|nr:hypothetical protein [Nitrospirota bacterium]
MKSFVKSFFILFMLAALVFLSSNSSLALKTPSENEKWDDYAVDEEGNAYFYNSKNVQHMTKNIVRVWIKKFYSQQKSKVEEAKLLWEIDCSKKTMRGIQAHMKNRDKTSDTIKKPSEWSSIPSESTAETLYEIVCKKGEKAK